MSEISEKLNNLNTNRKRYSGNAGYIAQRKFYDAYIVIYLAAEQGIDVGENKYAVSCETHGEMVGVTSLKNARSAMKAPDYCSGCRPYLTTED